MHIGTLYVKKVISILIYRVVCKIHAGHVITLEMILIKVFCHHVLLVTFISPQHMWLRFEKKYKIYSFAG